MGSLRECLASLKTDSWLEVDTQRRGIKFQVDGLRAPTSPQPPCAPYPHTFGNAYALYAMKRDGLARVSKIDVDALLDKNKSLAEGAILFPTFDVGGNHGAIFANSGFFGVKKEAARLLRIRMGQVRVP